MSFCHLHVHTEYSVLDGLSKIEEMIIRAKEMGQKAIAVTDHGSTSGLFDLVQYGKKHDMHVVMGTEFYYKHSDDKRGHVVALAQNQKGLENIFKMQELSYVKHFYYKPQITWQVLCEHKEGVIVTSACLANEICQYIIEGRTDLARNTARMFKKEFGDNFYIEIQPNSIPEQFTVNKELVKIADEMNIKLLATNDVHYINEDDAFPHEVLLALQTNKKMDDEKRFKFSTNDFWLKSEAEMQEGLSYLSSDVINCALNNTEKLALSCNATLEFGDYLPHFHTIPEGKDERQMLADIINNNYKSVIVDKGKHSSKYIKDVQHELDVIDRNGYSGYFLIVQDYVNHARNNNCIVGDGRGSGAGSKVAYITGITRIDPEEYDLLFERFMADGRQPDFDVDFSDQELVFKYLQSKYGIENVARIRAFGTMTAKAVTRKVLSCFGHEQSFISKINGFMPKRISFTLDEAIEESPDLKRFSERYAKEFEVIKRLEGVKSHDSKHAGGVIICENMNTILPIVSNGNNREDRIVGFDKKMLEELGHYKFDVLGLETLPVLKNTLDSIKLLTGEDVDLHEINYEDENVYHLLSNGDVSGVFQLANQGHLLKSQKPNCFKDLIAINALLRPGVGDFTEYIARRNGKPYTLHPKRTHMIETAGIMTYQEQYLLDCKVFAGWDVAYADKHVRKNKDILSDDVLMNKFYKDSVANGIDIKDAVEVWDEIQNAVSGGYGFNKSHAASYAMISYQTAWLKYYYPIQFYAALMTSEGNDQTKVSNLIAECKEKRIPILPPDINISDDTFKPTKNGIRYRITTVSCVGDSAIKHINSLRPIDGLGDMITRGEKRYIKKNVVINLIKAGCFDFEGKTRAELLWEFDMFNRTKTQIKNEEVLPKYEWNEDIQGVWEFESLGMYLTRHPMEKYSFKDLLEYHNNDIATIGGQIVDVAEIRDKNGNLMAFITISNQYGNTKCIAFSSLWKGKTKDMLTMHNVVMIKGKRSDDCCLINEVEVLVQK